MQRNLLLFFIFPVLFSVVCSCQRPTEEQTKAEDWVISAPAGDAYTQVNHDSTTIIPNGRLLTPRGKQIVVAPHPYGLVMSPDGNTVITANSGTNPLSISIIRNIQSSNPTVQQIPPGAETEKGILASVFMGLAISPDNQTVYVGGGQENKVFLFDVNTGASKGFINCAMEAAGKDYTHGYIGDLVLSKDGKKLYAVDQINFRMVAIDTDKKKVVHNVGAGRYPFGITLSPDEKKVYVANVGMYEYSLIPGITRDSLEQKALKYPAFPYLSKESVAGINTDTLKIPGLGDPNAPESFSVWTIDFNDSNNPTVTAKVKTGILVGQMLEDFPAVGGASPNSLVATQDYLFVSNGNNDCVSVIDVRKDTVVQNIFLTPEPRLSKLRGVIPFGMALSPDQKRLYVAESGINAVGVIDVVDRKVLGHVPVGWFPAKLKVSNDGKKLIIANAKGFGSGPNAGANFNIGPEGSSVGRLMKGTVSVLDIPEDKLLNQETKQVIANNFKFEKPSEKLPAWNNNPVPLYPGHALSPIKYIVFISKENRTYDEIFGQITGGKGDSLLARYGSGVTFTNKNKSRTIENATVMPNHLALAQRFGISDNFYCDSDYSADGHRWLVNTYPNEWVETSVSASQGKNRNMKENSKAPGNFAMVGSSGAIYPEDYNEAGSMWDHLERHGIDFFNFGFGLELAPGLDAKAFKYTGVRHIINYPVPAPMYNKSSQLYATFNMGIPDQFRTDMFIKEFNDRWTGEGKTMPSILTVLLPQDHGSDERPADGYPFNESYMADNDLALGRLVEFLSSTPYWKNMAIIVTEDDPQGGVDHIDAHRSILMVISPYAKKNYVSHVHYSFGSIFKTMWNILGLPYLNQYDAGATDMTDFFTDHPDFTPYHALPVDARIFDPQKALTPLNEKFNWKAVVESPMLDNPEDMERRSKEDDKVRAGKQ